MVYIPAQYQTAGQKLKTGNRDADIPESACTARQLAKARGQPLPPKKNKIPYNPSQPSQPKW